MFFTVCLQLFYYRDGQHISIDLSWIFMPTWLHVGLIFRLLVHLGASRARLGAFWTRLGGVLAASWGVLDRSWGVLGASWGRLRASWGFLEASWGRLGASWEVLERLGGISSWMAFCNRF